MGQHACMAQAILDLGLDPAHLWAVDIPYSAQDRIVDRLVEMGVPRSQLDRHEYTLSLPYPQYQRQRVSKMLHRLCDKAENAGTQVDLVVLVRKHRACGRRKDRG